LNPAGEFIESLEDKIGANQREKNDESCEHSSPKKAADGIIGNQVLVHERGWALGNLGGSRTSCHYFMYVFFFSGRRSIIQDICRLWGRKEIYIRERKERKKKRTKFFSSVEIQFLLERKKKNGL